MPAVPQSSDRAIDGARASDRVSDRRETRRLERPSRVAITDGGAFALDTNRIPNGMVMEWKRHEIMGFVDRHNQVVVRQNHWVPVPHRMQPHILGHLCKDPEQDIVVAGQGLYMRPQYLNADAMQEQQEETDYTLNQQLQSLRLSSKEQVGERFTKIKKTVVAAQPVE